MFSCAGAPAPESTSRKTGRLTAYVVTHPANSRNEKETTTNSRMSDVGPTFQVTVHDACTSWTTMCITAVYSVQVCSCGLCVQAVKRHRCVRWFWSEADVRVSLHLIVLGPTRRPLVRWGIGQEWQGDMKDCSLTPIRMSWL